MPHPKSPLWVRLKTLLVLAVLFGVYTAYALSRSYPTLRPVSVANTVPSSGSVSLPWPSYGESAMGAVGYGLLAHNGPDTPVPTASTAKVLTALSVLHKKPLQPGQQGPLITLTDTDVKYYDDYLAEDGSVVPIYSGEQITEYQALQALLLPSANNIAETLAVWAFGSEKAYTDFANSYATQLGMVHTHVADSSGFSPQTVSTATDLIRLGDAALANPIIKGIVAQPHADFPYTNGIDNVNQLLGQDGINGIKTGNTDQAGGVYLVSATYTVLGHEITVIEALMGAPSLFVAMRDASPLLDAAHNNFGIRTVLPAGSVVGYYNTPWHTSSNLVTSANLTIFGWRGATDSFTTHLEPASVPAKAGAYKGYIAVNTADGKELERVPVVIQQTIASPPVSWRLWH